ncbi:hypothetical protein VKT23_002927 [Stygiomarasmius scandens]
MVLELFLSISVSMNLSFGLGTRSGTMYLLWITPPFLALCVFIEALEYGIRNPEKVIRSNSGMICKVSDGVPAKVSAGFVIVAMLSIMIVEILVAVTVYRNWIVFKRLARHERDSNVRKHCASIIRFTFFFLLGLLCLGISIGISLQQKSNWSPFLNAQANIITEIIPLAAGLTFGTQKDILRSWMFWKTRNRPDYTNSGVSALRAKEIC